MNNYTKKMSALCVSLVLLLSLIPFALAEDEVAENEELDDLSDDLESVKAGTMPSSAFYGLDTALDSIRYALAGDKDNVGLKIAQERLEELKAMSREGKLEDAEKAREKHEKMLTKIKERVEKRLNDDSDDDDVKRAVRVERAVALQESELTELKDRLSDLTPEQRRKILAFLLEHEEGLGKLRDALNNRESEIVKKLKEKQSDDDEFDKEYDKLREQKRLKAQIIEGQEKSIVTVEYRFTQRSEETLTVEDLLTKTLTAVKTTRAEAEKSTKIERSPDDNDDLVKALEVIEGDVALSNDISDDDSSDDSSDDVSKVFGGERLRLYVMLKTKEGVTKADVQFKLRFLSTNDPEDIYNDIVTNTNDLTLEQLRAAARIKEQSLQNDDSKMRLIEVKVRERESKRIAEVGVKWDGTRDSFIIESGDKETIIAEIAARLNVSKDVVRAALKRFEVKETVVERKKLDDDSDSDDDSSDDDSESDDDDSDSDDDSGNDDDSDDNSGNSDDDSN